MLIADRNGMVVGGGWQNPYVTDGLIAMWDGEWNAGGGVHDPSAATWKDLAGSMDLQTSSSAIWHDKYAYCDGESYLAALEGSDDIIAPANAMTIEVCAAFNHRTAGPYYGFETLFYSGSSNVNSRAIVQDGATMFPLFSSSSRPAFEYAPSIDTRSTFACVYESSYGYGTPYLDGAAPTVIYRNSNRSPGVGTYIFGCGRTSNPKGNTQGNCYSVRIYSRALTAAEIAANYAIDKARFNLP